MILRRRLGAVVLALVALLVLGGCRLRAEINIDVADDGSGSVEVAVALDDAALERRPDLATELDLADLEATGWVVTGPAREADGDTWLRARHEFANQTELGPLIAEVAGPDGPFRDFDLTRSDAFAETRYDFSGTVDFTGGLESVTDDAELAEVLGDDPAQVLADQVGAVVDELVQVRVSVRLPGSITSNAPVQAANGASWSPSVLERDAIDLRAAGTVTHPERWALVAVAAAAGLVLVLILSIRLAARRRARAS